MSVPARRRGPLFPDHVEGPIISRSVRVSGSGSAANMITRRLALLAGGSAGLIGAPLGARAQSLNVLESAPKAHAVIGGRSSAFYVRFDRPVDHPDSRLAVLQNGRVVEVLHPRLESAPEVLFARAPTLPPGDYTLQWRVGMPPGSGPLEGEIPFTVSASQ